MVPCPCPDCHGSQEKHQFRLDFLFKKLNSNSTHIDCQKEGREVPLASFNLQQHQKTAFILSHPNDDEHAKSLKRHLTAVARKGGLEFSTKYNAPLGHNLGDFITNKLSFAEVVFILISPELYADQQLSTYMREVMDKSRRHAQHLVPIYLRNGVYGQEVTELTCLPRNGKALLSSENQDEAWADIARETGSLLFGDKW